MPAGGIVAGCSNENIGPVVCLLILAILILKKRSDKNKRLPIWTFLGLLGSIGGVAAMLFAPGTFNRYNMIEQQNNSSFLKMLMIRGYYMERAIFNYLFPTLLIGGIVLLVLIYLCHDFPDVVSILFLGAGVISVGAMILSPTYPPRATFGSEIFFVIAILRMIDQIIQKDKKIFYVFSSVIWFCYVAYLMQILTEIGYMGLKGVSSVPDFL